jgi:hypothetical protein
MTGAPKAVAPGRAGRPSACGGDCRTPRHVGRRRLGAGGPEDLFAGGGRRAALAAARRWPPDCGPAPSTRSWASSHLVAPGAPLRALVEKDRLTSAILWGPPGTGKTTLAR